MPFSGRWVRSADGATDGDTTVAIYKAIATDPLGRRHRRCDWVSAMYGNLSLA